MFCENLRKHTTKLINHLLKKRNITINKQRKRIISSHKKQEICHICKNEFKDYNDRKKCYRDKNHYHYTGKYRSSSTQYLQFRHKIP